MFQYFKITLSYFVFNIAVRPRDLFKGEGLKGEGKTTIPILPTEFCPIKCKVYKYVVKRKIKITKNPVEMTRGSKFGKSSTYFGPSNRDVSIC